METAFISPTSGVLTIDKMVETITGFVNKEPDLYYHLVIGSDSHEKKNGEGNFLNLVTAVVIHRQGKGGRYFWQRKILPKTHSLREKIYAETLASLNLAQELLPKVNKILNGKRHYDLEIHIDVGRIGETREMIKEVVGMVSGNGFKAKTKPESYGASKVADKHT